MSDQQVKNPEYDYEGSKAGDEWKKKQKEQEKKQQLPTTPEEFHNQAATDIIKKYGLRTFLELLHKYQDAPEDAFRRDNEKWGPGHYVKNEDWVGKD